MPLQGGCTERGAQNGFCGVLPGTGSDPSQQLFGAFLGEPRTFGMTVRAKLAAPGRAPVVEAVRRRRRRRADPDLPRRDGDSGAACPPPPPPPPPRSPNAAKDQH